MYRACPFSKSFLKDPAVKYFKQPNKLSLWNGHS